MLPSGRRQRAAGERVEGASERVPVSVCAMGSLRQLRRTAMCAILEGTETFQTVSRRFWMWQGKNCPCSKTSNSLWWGSAPQTVVHLRPSKTSSYPLPVGHSEPSATGGSWGRPCSLISFPPGTCFQKNKASGSGLGKCATEVENKVRWGAGASLPSAPAFPEGFAMAFSFPTIAGKKK